jgi:hypothetical protein
MAETKKGKAQLAVVPKRPGPGRPSGYSPQMAQRIARRIASGERLTEICSEKDMPTRATVFAWRMRHKAFADLYLEAQRCRAEGHVDEILRMADVVMGAPDATSVMAIRTKIDVLRWAACKFYPKAFGDKVTVENQVTLEDLVGASMGLSQPAAKRIEPEQPLALTEASDE